MNNIICDYCKNKFSTKSNLKTHQRKANYCKKLQPKQEIFKIDEYDCKYCHKNFNRKHHLDYHLGICKEKGESEKDKYIKDLEMKLEHAKEKIEIFKDHAKEKIEIFKELHNDSSKCIQEIAKKPTIKQSQHNQVVLAPFDLTEEKIKDIMNSHFDKNTFFLGQKGVAQLTASKLLRDENGLLKYHPTDCNRGHFEYIDNNGNKQKDIKAMKLTKMIYPSVVKKTGEIGGELLCIQIPPSYEIEEDDNYENILEKEKQMEEEHNKIYEEKDKIFELEKDLYNLNMDNTKFREELVFILKN